MITQSNEIIEAVVNVAKGTEATVNNQHAIGMIAIAAGLAIVGSVGTGLGQGIAAGKAAEAVGRNPEAVAQIRTMMIVGMAIAESAAIYAFVISLILLFVY